MEITTAHIERLKALANKKAPMVDDPEFNAYDYCGGNYDDAWYGGADDGEVQMARAILTWLGVEWKPNQHETS